jgi:hypothetical protein
MAHDRESQVYDGLFLYLRVYNSVLEFVQQKESVIPDK